MFRFFVNAPVTMVELSELHPAVLEALLEHSWNNRQSDAVELGHPHRRSDLPGRPAALVTPALAFAVPRITPGAPAIDVPALRNRIAPAAGGAGPAIWWPHLIYAYMIENTRVLEVFRRVVDLFLHGERLGALTPHSQRWLATTEELFFRDPPSYSILTQTSYIRPSLAATRANAYQRLFGMPLNVSDPSKQAFQASEQANGDFVQMVDELLHELWQGRSNYANNVGARPTDDSKIAELAERLSDMLRARRFNGTLSREEFMAVSTMEWFHATLEENNHPILVDLRAQAPSPEERLFKIAHRVGVPAHGLSKNYFEIAEPMSRLLLGIEEELYNDPGAVQALYTPPGDLSEDTDALITHWSIIRGRDVKAGKVAA
jgi:hypothetical protein